MKDFFSANFTSVVTSVIEQAESSLNRTIPADFKAYVAKFYTEALSAMLLNWVATKNPLDKQKTIQYLTTIIRTALNSMQYAEMDFK